MWRLLIILFFYGAFVNNASGQFTSVDIRYRFENAKSEQDFTWIVNAVTAHSSELDSNIIQSYKAVSKSALAQYVFSPYTKMKYFFNGKNELEICIENQKNLENIFLRLVVQLSIPSFLGYSDDIDRDLEYVKSTIETADVSLHTKQFIIETLQNTKNENYDLDFLSGLNLNTI